MTLPMLSILIFFTMFSTTLTHTSKPSQYSPNNLSNPNDKKPISFSTRLYSRRRYITRQPSNISTFSPSKVNLDVHLYPSQIIVMVIGIDSNTTSAPMLTTELLVGTGASLTWLQALPCDSCYNQGDFVYYNRYASKSYNPVYCQDEVCKATPDTNDCNDDAVWSSEPCTYYAHYGDHSTSKGVIGMETFYFHENMYVKFVPFGLGTSNTIPINFKGFSPGLAGLKRGSGTLLNKLGVKKFSHCFPREEEDTGILRFGEEAKIVGYKLVLNSESDEYEAILANVQRSVEDGALPEGMFFDTGTTWTYLSPQVMDAVVASIKIALRRYKPRHFEESELCYKTNQLLSVRLDEVAKVTFEFGYATKIDLLSFHVWILMDHDRLTCISFLRGNPGENIFGGHSMREVNIVYTLYEGDLAMYFNNQHCRK